jgi:hypothetical protein
MAEKSFIDSFHAIARERAADMERRQAEQNRLALEAEKARLDNMHEDDIGARKAIADRRVTLNMAWYASQLLLDEWRLDESEGNIPSPARPKEWLRNVDVFEEKGFFRKRTVHTGTRPEIALEGWQFYNFNDYIRPKRGTSSFRHSQLATALILDTEGNIQAVTDWQRMEYAGYDWESIEIASEGPAQIEQLHADPMDDSIRYTWTKIERPFDKDGEQVRLGGRIPGWENLRYSAGKDGEHADFKAGSHERHNRYKIEDRIRRSLGELVARHNITLPDAS